MSKERAHLDLDDNLDLSEFAPKTQKDHGRPNPKALETVAEQSGFVSRENKRRRKRQRSPYREAVKAMFQEIGDRLDIYDHTTFEQALLALIEKEGYSDLEVRFKELTK